MRTEHIKNVAHALFKRVNDLIRVDIPLYIKNDEVDVLVRFLTDYPNAYQLTLDFLTTQDEKRFLHELLPLYTEYREDGYYDEETFEIHYPAAELIDLFDLLVCAIFDYPLTEFNKANELRKFRTAVYGGDIGYIFHNQLTCADCANTRYREYGEIPHELYLLSENSSEDDLLYCDACSATF